MFSWLSLANILFKVVNSVLAHLERKELMDAGELKAIQKNNEVALKQVQVANEIRNQNKRLSESDVTDELSKYTRGSDSNDQ